MPGRAGRKLMLLGIAAAMLFSGCSGSNGEKLDHAVANDAKSAASPQAANSEVMADRNITTTSKQVSGPSEAQGQGAGMTSQAAQTPQADDTFSRKIIYRANLTMQVDSYEETEALVQEAVRAAGGYVLQFSENASATEKFGSFVIKVPATGFESLIGQLEKINPAMRKSMEGQDVTEEYVDLSSTLKAKELMEERLLAFMEKATKTDELVAFSTELGKVQEEIARIKGRMRYLEQNVSYSTIDLRIVQKIASADVIGAKDRGPLGKRASQALDGSLAVLNLMLQGLIVMGAGALPILVLLALIGVPVLWARRKRQARQAELRRQRLEENRRQTGKEERRADGTTENPDSGGSGGERPGETEQTEP